MGLWGAGARYGVGAVGAVFWAASVFKPQLCPIEARCGTPVPRSGVTFQAGDQAVWDGQEAA